MSAEHSIHAVYRESLLEHLFAGEIMRYVWLSGVRRLEVLKAQVDDGGYDIVLESVDVVRHVQLKSSFIGLPSARLPDQHCAGAQAKRLRDLHAV